MDNQANTQGQTTGPVPTDPAAVIGSQAQTEESPSTVAAEPETRPASGSHTPNEGAAARVMAEAESVQRAKFPPLREEDGQSVLGKIEYLKDVDLDTSVELGSTVLTVESILGLHVGSIIELNQTVGDQVRLLINSNPYAFGEVVVIGDKFGVRITKLIHE